MFITILVFNGNANSIQLYTCSTCFNSSASTINIKLGLLVGVMVVLSPPWLG